MAHIADYLDWRGDLSFAVSPFNEVDNYIFCKLGELNYAGVIPEGGAVTVSQLSQSVLRPDNELRLGLLSSPQLIEVLRRLPETPRYQGLLLSDFVDRLDEEQNEQFSALTITMPDGVRYVAFRGTDDTLLAWKEDFLLGVQETVEAQKDALRYLLLQAKKRRGKLIVGGHSKGGNLAVYASMMAPPAVQRRIIAVYNNDGPGFRTDVSKTEGYLRIRDRLHTIVSQHTMVGKLLCHEARCEIVHSDRMLTAAHDGLNWQVLGTKFVRCEDYTIFSKAFEWSILDLQERMNLEERQQFVDALFGVLTSTGAVTLTDLTEHKLRQALAMARELRQAPEVYRFLLRLAGLTTKKTLQSAKDAITSSRWFPKKSGDS